MKDSELRRYYMLHKHTILTSKTSRYRIKKILGCGAFGLVLKCENLETGKHFAVKVTDWHVRSKARCESKNLKHLDSLGSEQHNIVKFYESFSYMGQVCFVFDKLDMNLMEFKSNIVGGGLNLCDIRVIAEQLLVALQFLEKHQYIHRDIKPDNIMVSDRKLLKVKLIDFTCLVPRNELRNGTFCPQIYKAPEDHLHAGIDQSVDMWNLGCTLAYLYLGDHLFHGRDEREVWMNIVGLLGNPGKDVLQRGEYTWFFYEQYSDGNDEHYVLKTYGLRQWSGAESCQDNRPPIQSKMKIKSLDDLLHFRPGKKDCNERNDLIYFIDLLKKMLHLDRKERILASEALTHCFITMKHFPVCDINSPYVREAHEKMKNSKLQEGETVGACSETSIDPNSKTPTSDKVSSVSSNSTMTSSDSTLAISSLSLDQVVESFEDQKYPRNIYHTPTTDSMYSVPESTIEAIPFRGVYPDSLSSKTSTSDSVYPDTSYSNSAATYNVSPVILSSKTSSPEGEFKNQYGKMLKSSLKKTTRMTNATNMMEVKTKRITKTVRFNPIVIYVDMRSLHPADQSDQQEKMQSKLPKTSSSVTDSPYRKDGKTKTNSKVTTFNPAIFNIFNKTPPESADLSDQKKTPPTTSRCMVMNKQHKTSVPLTKGSEHTKASRSESTSDLVTVKTKNKYWKRIKTFFSNIGKFCFCIPSYT